MPNSTRVLGRRTGYFRSGLESFWKPLPAYLAEAASFQQSCILIRRARARMLNFSMVVSGSAAVTYLLDTHRANALHIFALSNFGKNMVLYASTFFANGLVQSRGPRFALIVLGACQAVCWLSSVPMYVFGKRVRAFVSTLSDFRPYPTPALPP